jgi:hypothetical protein
LKSMFIFAVCICCIEILALVAVVAALPGL